MKNLLSLLLFLLVSLIGKAQTFDEWFRQKKTQKEYLLQQIAAFQVYQEYVQKGYGIAKEGLTAISDSKKGDFHLHQDFFGSLKEVNLNIKEYTKVADIVMLQREILKLYNHVSSFVKTKGLFDAKDVDYCLKVLQNILDDASAIVVDVTAVVTPNVMELKDNERLSRIDALYTRMQEAYTFAQHFKSELKLLLLQRMQDAGDVQASRLLLNIKTN